MFLYVSDHLKTQEMCNEAVEVSPFLLKYAPDNLKDAGAVLTRQSEGGPWNLRHVPDWFVTQQTYDIIIGLLNVTMVIKNARPKKQK